MEGTLEALRTRTPRYGLGQSKASAPQQLSGVEDSDPDLHPSQNTNPLGGNLRTSEAELWTSILIVAGKPEFRGEEIIEGGQNSASRSSSWPSR